jgi:hypothetical protein
MTKTAIAISPMMTNVLSVATIPPATVTASNMAKIAPRIVPMIRPMPPVCRRIYADGEPDAIIALPFPRGHAGPRRRSRHDRRPRRRVAGAAR